MAGLDPAIQLLRDLIRRATRADGWPARGPAMTRWNMAYDSNNVFAKILRGEIPSVKVYEDTRSPSWT
jgi:hypothetical protein